MVNFALPTLALCIAASVAAMPTISNTTRTEFTFTQWIEDIIADPTGSHLSPEEAVAAKSAAVAAKPLRARANCDVSGWARANAVDASSALSYLAGIGNSGTVCALAADQFGLQMWRVNNAQISGSKSSSAYQGANCADVARTGGLIFDSCWRSDGTVLGSLICTTNSNLQINILGV